MDQATRNSLQNATQQARRLLEREITEQLEGTFDVLPNGTIADKPGQHLDAAQRLVRTKIVESIRHRAGGGTKTDLLADAVADYVREASFTILNRYIALKMLEVRRLVQQCVSKGEQSSGFKEFGLAAAGLAQLADKGYRLYLESLFDELSTEVKILFDRHSDASLLWPRRQAFDGLLEILNADDLATVWKEDETIGWVYQYFNSQEERRAMRDASQAPRNSRELAVRNQFFTPRYVVEFLTDNTLGRTWYEMRQGVTSLADKCRYLVRRPDEVFLSRATVGGEEGLKGPALFAKFLADPSLEGVLPFCAERPQPLIDLAHCVDAYLRHPIGQEVEGQWWPWHMKTKLEAAESLAAFTTQDILDVMFCQCRADRHGGGAGIATPEFARLANEVRQRVLDTLKPDQSQEDLLRQPVFVAYRPKKDPRDLKILDPACGSSHFLLYCFDLLLIIYEEAWSDELSPASQVTGQTLKQDYPTVETLHAAVPGLILRHNVHGIDIDARCAQIGAFALWMRAQRAYNDFKLPKAKRPPITKSNIVVAEPMPGEDDLLADFLRGLREDRLESLIREALKVPPEKKIRATKAMAESLCDLVRTIWDRMKLAGEAGSLLRIDNSLEDAITKGRAEWEDKHPLFRVTEYSMTAPHGEKTSLMRELPGEEADFWSKSEVLVIQALRRFSQGAGATAAASFRRGLFAEDAARGLAFIDVCRVRMDVVLMNPPFGLPTAAAYRYLQEVSPLANVDLYPAFVVRAAAWAESGLVGVVSSRSFLMTPRLTRLREDLLRDRLRLIADLGHGVMDAAEVEAAAYVYSGRAEPRLDLIACNARFADDKSLSLLQWSITGEATYVMPKQDIAALPGSRIFYSLPHNLQRLLRDIRRFDPLVATARGGCRTFDDVRFLRAMWEIPAECIGVEGKWRPYAKGGEYARYYGQIYLVVNWAGDGAEVGEKNRQINGQVAQARQGSIYYGREGGFYSQRSKGFAVRALPTGCVFSSKGPAIFSISDTPTLLWLGWINTPLIRQLVEFQANKYQFDTGILRRLPWLLECSPTAATNELMAATLELVRLSRRRYSLVETDAAFAPQITAGGFDQWYESQRDDRKLVAKRIGLIEQQWSDHVESVYGVTAEAVAAATFSGEGDPEEDTEANDEQQEAGASEAASSWATESAVRQILSFLLGMSLGRWSGDVLRRGPDDLLEDPFADLGSTVHAIFGARKLAAEADSTSCSAGLAVDDEGHPLDLVQMMEAQLALWGPSWQTFGGGAARTKGSQNFDLRDWLRSRAFDEHLAIYSKGKRRAPIYWQLGPASGQASVWLYCHMLSKDTLFRVSNEHVAPRLRHEETSLGRLRSEAGESPTKSQREAIEHQESLVWDLNRFAEELALVAPLWKPFVHDGVLINACIGWRLFPHRAWQQECRACWDALCEGEFDWSGMAMHLWPERVVPRCIEDSSYAIAHGLINLFWEQNAKGRWIKKEPPAYSGRPGWHAVIDRLVAERSSRLVKDALTKLIATPVPEGGQKRGRKRTPRSDLAANGKIVRGSPKRKAKSPKARDEFEELF